MGRTLWGVDLDESPAGGLVERLLTDEEIEKLADGGRPEDGSDDGDATASTDGGSDGDDTEWTTNDHSDKAWSSDTGSTFGDDDFSMGGDDEDEGIKQRLWSVRKYLAITAVGLALLAALAALLWRYSGTISETVPTPVPDRFSSDGGESEDAGSESESGDDVSPARRRAKATGEDADEPEWTTRDHDSTAAEPTGDDGEETAESGSDLDPGALAALGTLALIAAVVRKFGEGREYDPLVDGPRE